MQASFVAIMTIIIATPSFGQAVQLEGVFRAGTTISLGIGSNPTSGIVLSGRSSGQVRTKANAVVVGHGYALTSAHCVRKDGMKLLGLQVGRYPAAVVLISNDLALLAVSGDLSEPAAVVPREWHPSRPSVGERLSHIYFNHVTKAASVRVVTWNGLSSINEGFLEGMSGSGLYSLDGSLVGIAEWTTGYAEGSLAIAAFASQCAHLGLACFGANPVADASKSGIRHPAQVGARREPEPSNPVAERL